MGISVLTAWKIETNETTILESKERVELWLVKNGVPHSLLVSCPHANKDDLLKAVEEIKRGIGNMSLKTWKDEFMPVPVDEVPTDNLSLLQRDLKKWKGLRKDNLLRHNLTATGSLLFDLTDEIPIDSSTCSLCYDFLNKENRCANCPLYKNRKARCDDYKDDPYRNSPYHHFTRYGNPEPMIELIQNAIEEIGNE